MSGIFGIWNTDGAPVDPSRLRGMAGRMSRPAPVGREFWSDGPIGLGARGRLVWDGRLDNREELAGLLGLSGADDPTDQDLVLRAYELWGDDCPQKILGDFAFAVWDPGRRALFCARDYIGVKPLYYRWDGPRFSFASEIKALLFDDLPREPDDAMIAGYLLMDFQDPEATFFKGIRQLRPGHSLWIEGEARRSRRYWEPDPSRESRFPNPRDYFERFEEFFKRSVRRRLPRGLPAAVLLSGGIDSSSVAATAAHLAREGGRTHAPLASFTWMTEGLLEEEWSALERLRGSCGLEMHYIRQEGDGAPALFEFYLDRVETLHYDGVLAAHILRAASQKGRRVLLTGWGADELSQSGEDGFLKDVLYSGRLGRFFQESASRSAAYGLGGNAGGIALDLLWRRLPSAARWGVKTAMGRQTPEWLDRGCARRLDLRWRMKPAGRRRFPTHSQEEIARALTAPKTCLALNRMDALSADLALECRHPYLDKELVEFFLSIPPSVRMREGYRKMFVQKSLERLVPGGARPTEGGGLHVAYKDSIESRRLESGALEERLFRSRGLAFRYVDRAAAERMLSRYAGGTAGPSERNILWNFADLEQWLEAWFAGRNGTS